MRLISGNSTESCIILHGGVGAMDPSAVGQSAATSALRAILTQATKLYSKTEDGDQMLLSCMEGMESDPIFNAGLGAALQSDGVARLTAAWMAGDRQTFSGVLLATHLHHPIRLARHLQGQASRVLSQPGCELLARQLQLPVESPLTSARASVWQGRLQAKDGETGYDTVGCVVFMKKTRHLWAATSTGGRGFEFPGRISDSGTVAGNYASSFAAISCTGVGEEIVDDGVAVRIETRVRDGMILKDACAKVLEEAKERKRNYGWIAVDSSGNWCLCHTTPSMLFVVADIHGNILADSHPPH